MARANPPCLNAVAGTFLVDEGNIRLAGRDVTLARTCARRTDRTRVSKSVQRHLPQPYHRGKPRLAARRGRQPRLGWGSEVVSRVENARRGPSRLNMGLEDRLENAIGSLSGGQRQAFTLLMATWLRPELLLLDEHTAALDPKSADQVIALTEHVLPARKLRP